MMRFVYCMFLFLTALFLPWWCFAVLALLYGMFYTPYELLLIGVVIDTSFGEVGRGFWYSYTIIAVLSVVLSRVIRPLIRIGI